MGSRFETSSSGVLSRFETSRGGVLCSAGAARIKCDGLPLGVRRALSGSTGAAAIEIRVP